MPSPSLGPDTATQTSPERLIIREDQIIPGGVHQSVDRGEDGLAYKRLMGYPVTRKIFDAIFASSGGEPDPKLRQLSVQYDWARLVESRIVGAISVHYFGENCDPQQGAHDMLVRYRSPFALTQRSRMGFKKTPGEPTVATYQQLAESSQRSGDSLISRLIIGRAQTHEEAASTLGALVGDIGQSLMEGFAQGTLDELSNSLAKLRRANKLFLLSHNAGAYDMRNTAPVVRFSGNVLRALKQQLTQGSGDRAMKIIDEAQLWSGILLRQTTQPVDLRLFGTTNNSVRIVPFEAQTKGTDVPQQRDTISLTLNPMWNEDNHLWSDAERQAALNAFQAQSPERKPEATIAEDDPSDIAARQAFIEQRRNEILAIRAAEAAEAEARAAEQAIRQAALRKILLDISSEHNGLLAPFTPAGRRMARETHILGSGNSLTLSLYTQLGGKEQSPLGIKDLEPIAFMIDSLLRVSNEKSESDKPRTTEWLTATLKRAAELRATFNDQKRQSNNNVDISLVASVAEPIDWIRTNWQDIEKAIRQSEYAYAKASLSSLTKLLGLVQNDTANGPEIPEVIAPTAAVTMPGEDAEAEPTTQPTIATLMEALSEAAPTAFEQVEALCKQLGWVVLPPDTDQESLGEDIREYIDTLKIEVDADAIREGRMGILLDLYEHFKDGNARLYRSAQPEEKILNGLYYLLLFEYRGDVYGIAENPVYKNATYVARQGLIPLQGSETVIEVFRLTRKNARYYEARQLVHGEAARGATDPQTYKRHLRLIINTIYELSQQQPL